MPNCRNCGARISKFDKDMCPVCGTKDPLKGVTSETIEITSQIDLNHFQEGQKVVCRRKKVLLFFLLFGFTGSAYFYMKRKKAGILWLILNIVLLGGLFALFFFPLGLGVLWSILIPLLIIYALNGAFAAIYFFLPDLKDGEGEFVV